MPENHIDEYSAYSAQDPGPDPQAWVLSYADLLSQLICFFVLLFSMSSVNNEEWEGMVRSLSQRLSLEKDVDSAPPAGELSIEKEVVPMAMELPYLHGILAQKFQDPELAKLAEVRLLDDRLVISFAGQEAFKKGSTEMQDGMKQGLALVAQFTHTLGNQIEVNGNADSTPVQGKTYPSNWELSLDRARVVADYLKEQGYPHAIRVFGRGDSAYFQLAANRTKEERDRIARRIDIVIRSERAATAGRAF